MDINEIAEVVAENAIETKIYVNHTNKRTDSLSFIKAKIKDKESLNNIKGFIKKLQDRQNIDVDLAERDEDIKIRIQTTMKKFKP